MAIFFSLPHIFKGYASEVMKNINESTPKKKAAEAAFFNHSKCN